MADRTDIDALLIGALYGELTPADEARLTAHLASHPADRTALADLTHTRDAVRATGLHRVWFEPPQAVSALVLQEAARRARPMREHTGESWFQRFLRSLTAHPALAAAMTIVVIAGVASTLYVRRADKFDAVSEDDQAMLPAPVQVDRGGAPTGALSTPPPGSPVVAAVPPPAAPAQRASAGSGALAAPASEAPEAKAAPRSETMAFRDAPKDMKAPVANKPAPLAKRKSAGIEVEERKLEPKELDDASPSKFAKQDVSTVRRQAGPAASGAGAANRDEVLVLGRSAAAAPAAAPPPPPAQIATDKSAGDGAVVDWAQRQRDQVIAYVRANNCRAAATAAVEIYNRAPDFYANNIAIDREVKPCLPYVTGERERVDRARAAKRGNAEPASPAPTPASPPRN